MLHDRVGFEVAFEVEHRDALAICETLRSEVEDFVASTLDRITSKRLLALGALVVRLANGLDAIALLSRRGFQTEAVALFRGLLEAAVKVCAISVHAELFDRYEAQDLLLRKRVLTQVRDLRAGWAPEVPRDISDADLDAQIAVVDAGIDQLRAAGVPVSEMALLSWAEKGNVLNMAHGNYPIASNALHHGPRDLEDQIILEGDSVNFVFGPFERDAEYFLFTSCRFVFRALSDFAHAIAADMPETIAAIHARWMDRFEAHADAELRAAGR